jgi:hypothetical protein
MASTYSALKIELIGTGEQSGTWGTTTNNNLGNDALGEAITGSADVAFSSSDVTITLTDTNASQAARNLRLNLTGTSGGARQLILGSGCQIEKLYLINNGLADAVTVKNTSGTGIAVPAGKTMFVFNNGTNVVDATTALSSVFVTSAITNAALTASKPVFTDGSKNLVSTGTLAVDQGGTGATTLTANNVILGNGTSAVAFVAPGSSGNLLTSNGTTWSSTTPAPSFVAGMIIMWSGTIATIPSGWLLCNGSSGTPDLRNRFIIGAFSDDSGTAKTTVTGSPTQTGGTKDAIVVSHTHTATVTDPTHTHSSTNGLPIVTSGGGTGGTIPSGGVSVSGSSVTSSSTGITVTNSTTGASGTNANLVPYYALAFIMKS